MQYALPALESICVDVAQLERRRDRVYQALTGLGYEVVRPEGTLYCLVRAPKADDGEFTELLARCDTFVLPGSVVELPGWVRLSLTASDAMIERAPSAFAAVKAAVPEPVEPST